MNSGANPADDAEVESSLRAAIKLNPSFAPPFEGLAALEGMRHRNLDEAHLLTLKAVQLDPSNVAYRVTVANVLMQMERAKDAEAVLHQALRLAKTPKDTELVQNLLTQVEEYASEREQQSERNRLMAEEVKSNAKANAMPAGEGTTNPEAIEEELPKGPHRFLVGKLQDVHCNGSAIDLNLAAKGKTMALHSRNYYKIEFTALGFMPKSDLNPCQDLEGAWAKVEYLESPAKAMSAHVVAIELHQ
jgi:hypothetical protein